MSNSYVISPPRYYQLPALSEQQSDVYERGLAGANLVVYGPGGSGKSTLALAWWKQAAAAGKRVLLLSPRRERAEALAAATQSWLLPQGPMQQVRSVSSFALSIVGKWHTERKDPLPAPVLLTGAEEDALLEQLLLRGKVAWPEVINPESLNLPAFRTQLRVLLARHAEQGWESEDLAKLGKELGLPQWEAAAAILRLWQEDQTQVARTRQSPQKFTPLDVELRCTQLLCDWEMRAGEDGVLEQRPQYDLVILDDFQDCTRATIHLMQTLATQGAQVICVGEPDIAAETFRGAAVSLLRDIALRLNATEVALAQTFRGNPRLRQALGRVLTGIPVQGPAGRRRCYLQKVHGQGGATGGSTVADNTDGGVRGGGAGLPQYWGGLFKSEEAENRQLVAIISRYLLSEEYSPAGIAVIARSNGQLTRLEREFRLAKIPVAHAGAGVSLNAEPAVRPLLEALFLAQHLSDLCKQSAGELADSADIWGQIDDVAMGATQAVLNRQVSGLLSSALIGLDILSQKQLRHHLAQKLVEIAQAPQNTEEQLAREVKQEAQKTEPWVPELADLLYNPDVTEMVRSLAKQQEPGQAINELHTEYVALARAIDMIEQAGQVLTKNPADLLTALWALWSASGCAEVWQQEALKPWGQRAEHNLDAIMALFKSADVWAQRHPRNPATAYARELLSLSLPGGTVASRGQAPSGVSLLTPAAAAGQEWKFVAIVGLQEGVWPNLRVRDNLLHADKLVEIASGLPWTGGQNPGRKVHELLGNLPGKGFDRGMANSVLADETRFLALGLSRATQALYFSAVATGEETPSQFFSLLDACQESPAITASGTYNFTEPWPLLEIRSLVAGLRRGLQVPSLPNGDISQESLKLLAFLAACGVEVAHSPYWPEAQLITSNQPVIAHTPRLSPSAVEGLLNCPLRWFLDKHGGKDLAGQAATIGNLIHELAAEYVNKEVDGIEDSFAQKWEALALPDTWANRVAFDKAKRIVGFLSGYLRDSRETTEKATAEVVVEAEINGVLWYGRIDRLEELANGEYRVVDFKTGSALPPERPLECTDGKGDEQIEVDMQLAAYMAIIANLKNLDTVHSQIVHVGTDRVNLKPRDYEFNSRTKESILKQLVIAGELAKGPDYRATPSTNGCKYCSFAGICPAKNLQHSDQQGGK